MHAMKTVLLLSTALTLALPISRAKAQAAVMCVNCTDEFSAVASYAATAISWGSQIKWMEQQYQQLTYEVQSLQHLNPRAMMTGQGLMNDATRLPGSVAGAVPGLNYGQSLSTPGQRFYDQNRYYTPQGNDYAAQEMQRRQYATANLQGESMTGMTTIRARLASLTQLENSIPSQPDVQATAAINARIEAEKSYLANESIHVQHLQLMQETQAHVDQQRAEQRARKQADQWNSTVAAQAWGG
jgi:flagellar biosynthesis chaperone FliJ